MKKYKQIYSAVGSFVWVLSLQIVVVFGCMCLVMGTIMNMYHISIKVQFDLIVVCKIPSCRC